MTLVDGGPRAAAPIGVRQGRLGRLFGAPLWANVAALAVILAIAFPLMSPNSSFTSDEGAYALQAEALGRSSWAYDYRAAPLDPTGGAFPLLNSSRHGDQFFAYIQHPAYPLLLRGAAAALGGTVGLHLWPLLGTLGVAVAAWLLAGEVDPRLRAWAFWLAAAGPALANGYLLWAHTLSAAVAGLTLVPAVRAARHGLTHRRTAAVGAGLGVGVLLRAEGLLFAAAVAIVLTVIEARRAHGRPSVRVGRTALTFAALAGPAITLVLVERVWVRRIAGGAYDNLKTRSASDGYVAGRISGAWHDLFQAPTLTFVALAVVVGFGLLALRRWEPQSPRAVATAVAAAGALAVIQFLRHPSDPISGLFAACPVLLLGVLLVPWRSAAPAERFLGAIAALFMMAVVATEYAVGGALEWGGRFFSPLLAPLAVLAVVGVARRLPSAAGDIGARRAVTAVLAGLVAIGALMSLITVGHIRHGQEQLTAAVRHHPALVTVTTIAAFPRLAWAADRQVTWMVTNDDDLGTLLSRLRSLGVEDVALVAHRSIPVTGLAAYPDLVEASEPALRAKGLALFVTRR